MNKSRLRLAFQRLATLVLITATTVSWQSTESLVHSQAVAQVRCSDSLKLKEIESGLEYGQTKCGQASNEDKTGPWLINTLRVDLKRARLKVVHALDEGVGLETVSSLAQRHRAAAATNGGYFRTTGTYRGEPIGVLLLEHKLISEPHNDRAAFGLIEKGTSTDIIFGRVKFSGDISIGSAKRSVRGLNRPLETNDLVVFTPSFHRTTLTDPGGIEVVVRRNRVTAISDSKGSSEIPADGYVISAVGQARDWIKRRVRKGAWVLFNWRLAPIEANGMNDWIRAHSLLGGGPQLIRAGKIAITTEAEKMRAGFDTELHPRTAIAKLKSGKVMLVTVDGRQPGVSAGMSLFMLADLLLELGAVEAINLDGGGSTTMVIGNKIVNRPADQAGERPVGDAILIFPKRN